MIIQDCDEYRYLHISLLTNKGETQLTIIRKLLNAKTYSRVGSLTDGNVTALEVYFDKYRGSHTLYVAVNKTNLSFTTVHAVTFYVSGNWSQHEPPLKVQDSCVTHIKTTFYFLVYSCPTYTYKDESNNNHGGGFGESEGTSSGENQGKIYVTLRSTYEAIFEIAGAGSGARFGSGLQVIESLDGLQL